MPSATLASLSNNSLCSTCGKEFKNSKGLKQHKQIVQKYNQRQQELDKLSVKTIDEFKQIIITEIHKKLPLNFRSMGKKLISIPCPESLFFLFLPVIFIIILKQKEFIDVYFVVTMHIKFWVKS